MNTKYENFTRAIKDMPLLATSWKCRFGWHTWEKYSDPFNAVDKYGLPIMVQTRKCTHCNKMDVSKVKAEAGQTVIFNLHE